MRCDILGIRYLDASSVDPSLVSAVYSAVCRVAVSPVDLFVLFALWALLAVFVMKSSSVRPGFLKYVVVTLAIPIVFIMAWMSWVTDLSLLLHVVDETKALLFTYRPMFFVEIVHAFLEAVLDSWLLLNPW